VLLTLDLKDEFVDILFLVLEVSLVGVEGLIVGKVVLVEAIECLLEGVEEDIKVVLKMLREEIVLSLGEIVEMVFDDLTGIGEGLDLMIEVHVRLLVVVKEVLVLRVGSLSVWSSGGSLL
jgi:hypothetical protein